MSWIYRNKEILTKPPNKEAFVYLLEYKDKKYIGYKKFENLKKVNISKREKKATGTRKRKKWVKKEEWQNYYSSNKFFTGLSTAEKKKVKRTILHVCSTTALAKYYECYEQFKRHVLMPDSGYVNGNIQYKSFDNIFNKHKK